MCFFSLTTDYYQDYKYLNITKTNNIDLTYPFIFAFRFVQTSSRLQDVTLIKKFSDWKYEINWYSNPRKRFPYLGRASSGKALLTTATHDDYTEYGTIIANTSEGRIPAKWMRNKMQSPGVVWYWLNENDCNLDYGKGLFCIIYCRSFFIVVVLILYICPNIILLDKLSVALILYFWTSCQSP